MNIIPFETKLIDFEEFDFYSDADDEFIDVEGTDLDIRDVRTEKTLMD